MARLPAVSSARGLHSSAISTATISRIVEAALQNSMRTGAPFRARYRTPPREQHDEHWLEAAGKIAGGETATADDVRPLL